MLQTNVTISSDNDETARIEAAEKLGVEPDEVAVESADGETYTVSMLNAPGQLDIVVSDHHMNATIRTITPPFGNGKPVEVKDIEGANVEADADISIKGGIIGSGEGKVHAGGDLTVRFIENAQVHANGNINIRNDIVRSNVSAGGSIICKGGKGRIRGGAVSAGKAIVMNEIGSPSGIITHVSVGAVSEFRERLVNISKNLAGYRKNKAKMGILHFVVYTFQ